MCFKSTKQQFNKAMTEVRKEAKKRGGDIVVFKILRLDRTNHVVRSLYYDFPWKVGENKTAVDKPKWEVSYYYYGDRQQRTEINKGFHAYRTKELALQNCCGEDRVIVSLSVKIADVVAANNTEVVFKQGKLLACAEQRLSLNLNYI